MILLTYAKDSFFFFRQTTVIRLIFCHGGGVWGWGVGVEAAGPGKKQLVLSQKARDTNVSRIVAAVSSGGRSFRF